MKVVVSQENLQIGLNKVARTVAANATLPVLANVLLTTASDASLGLATNNLDAGTFCTVDAEVLDPGSISVPARLLTGLAASFPKEKITLEVDEYTQTLTVTCLDFVAKIAGIDAVEFPTVNRINASTAQVALADPEALKEAIDHVLFCIPSDQSRPILTGAEMIFDGRKLTIHATDGFRLTEQTLTLADGLGRDTFAKAIVPAPVLADLSRVLNGRETLLQIAFDGNVILFNLDEVDIAGRLIEGKYPDIRGIIPTQYTTLTRVRCGELLRAVKVSHWFAKESANICKVFLTGDRVEVSSAADGKGSNTAVVQAVGDGADLEIAFNSKYLIDVLSALPEAAELLIETTTAGHPGLIRVVGCDSFLHVLMPMHIDRDKEKKAAEPAPVAEEPATAEEPAPAEEPAAEVPAEEPATAETPAEEPGVETPAEAPAPADEIDAILAEVEAPAPAAKRSRKSKKTAEAPAEEPAEVAAEVAA